MHKMTKDEQFLFIRSLQCPELFQELTNMMLLTKKNPGKLRIPSFFTGVYQTLIQLGYDRSWVEREFREEVEHHYIAQTVAYCNANPELNYQVLPFLLEAYFQH